MAKTKRTAKAVKGTGGRGESGGALDADMMDYAARLDSGFEPFRRIGHPPVMAGVELADGGKTVPRRTSIADAHYERIH